MVFAQLAEEKRAKDRGREKGLLWSKEEKCFPFRTVNTDWERKVGIDAIKKSW